MEAEESERLNMKMLGIYNSKNRPFRKDGDEYQREAQAWFDAHDDGEGGFPWLANVTDGRVRAEIRKFHLGLDVLAIFDHGSTRGLPRMRENLGNVKGLAETIAGVTKKIKIILYACSCGRGWWKRIWKNKKDMKTWTDSYNPRDGYAVALCCELAQRGVDVEVWAHLTGGHLTWNPHVVLISNRFAGWVLRLRWIGPKDPEWKEWKRDMKGPLRFTFWH